MKELRAYCAGVSEKSILKAFASLTSQDDIPGIEVG